MKKILFSTILGITVTGAATASIVSRGFFEEAMENYATNTALDLKANQSDLTALSNIVGTNNWDINNKGLFFMSFPFYQELGYDTEATNATWVDTGNITSMFSLYNTNTNVPGFAGVTNKLLNGWINDRGTTYQGIKALNDGWLDRATSTTYRGVKRLNDVIGTLPTGELTGELFSALNTMGIPATYPTNLAELIDRFFGGTTPGILRLLFGGFPIDFDGDGVEEAVGMYSNFMLASEAKELATTANTTANANAAKIGALPIEYATVGAALSAIKGIAEEAKQKAEAAIPDPKAEGATGKYVLTVDIADSSAIPVYRWEKIDRALDETQSEQ